ncbi:nucleotidyltransferase domain-containing protein [Paenibacillus paridis]|uniref:nucleotidyltransferase domain-containing protein n=1 Tax=Paenibacillus paridis TaxID=2583376 RepID=UPI001123AE10|nr:nucleotidyltransferase domain-containing protein [Paenibacillus paridis]
MVHWKQQLYDSANRVANQFKDHPGIVSVAIGGSLARGMAWKHSDLELCVLVDQHLPELQYFNYMENIGVEIIQVSKQQVEDFLMEESLSNEAVLRFPIQIYKCRIVHDPSGLMAKFKAAYDDTLFDPAVTAKKREQALESVDQRYALAESMLSGGFPNTALAHLRLASNDLLLAYYWHYLILPRSQNRTVYLLKQNAERFGFVDFYHTFIHIFGLNQPLPAMKQDLFQAQNEIYQVANTGWGSNAVLFLQNAVDHNLEWGYDKSILYVYKWCVHLLQTGKLEERDVYDHEQFKADYPKLFPFLDFDKWTSEEIRGLFDRFYEARSKLTY